MATTARAQVRGTKKAHTLVHRQSAQQRDSPRSPGGPGMVAGIEGDGELRPLEVAGRLGHLQGRTHLTHGNPWLPPLPGVGVLKYGPF